MLESIRKLARIMDMQVRDAQDRMYLPVFGYDGQVAVYMLAEEALLIAHEDIVREGTSHLRKMYR